MRKKSIYVYNKRQALHSQCALDLMLEALSFDFSQLCKRDFGLEVPNDFLLYATAAMCQLTDSGRSNVLYNLAKGIGSKREDKDDSRFPTKRMPMGLIEYSANFFVAEDINQVPKCPQDYRSWQQTMYCQFGQKWAKLHHGPMWSVSQLQGNQRTIMMALPNIPALSESTIRRDIASSGISMDAKIQESVLDEAARSHPNSWWWIKADGCDLVSGLGESISGKWSGDVNLKEGVLDKLYMEYKARLDFVAGFGLGERSDDAIFQQDLGDIKQHLMDDINFITSVLCKVNDEYEKKQEEGKQGKEMFGLAWDIKELTDLNEEGRQIIVDCSTLGDRLSDINYDRISNNLASRCQHIRERILSFVKRTVKYRRTAATHVLVVMISPEERNSKPYALTIQCIAYKSIKDSEIRDICNNVVKKMTLREMKVAGFCTNGEWNSLRSKGNTRPLSIFEIWSRARNYCSRLSLKKNVGNVNTRTRRRWNFKSCSSKSCCWRKIATGNIDMDGGRLHNGRCRTSTPVKNSTQWL